MIIINNFHHKINYQTNYFIYLIIKYSSYEGDFRNNDIEGFGTYIWGDGRKYVGLWKDNKMDGKGEFHW